MRKRFSFFAVTALIAFNWPVTPADAAFYSYPRALTQSVGRIAFDGPSLAPMAYAAFCIAYPEECRARPIEFRPRPFKLTDERWAELVSINNEVNRAIIPQANKGGLRTEQWLIAPRAGDCNDYAVTKRHRLIALGWPPGAVVLAEVATMRGEHHLVVLVRTAEGDLVLDNLRSQVLPWSKPKYRWLRIQSPKNPNYWSRVGGAAV
jgi:predicted transglutaminase-like cysteine proteinase